VRRRQKEIISLVALIGIVWAGSMWRMGAFSDRASGDISPEISISEEQDELSFELKSPPPASRKFDTRTRSYSDARQPASSSKLDATAGPTARNDVDAIAETTAENVADEKGENGSNAGRLSPLQFAPLSAGGGGAASPLWSAGAASLGLGIGAAPPSDSLADYNGEIPKETASTARVGRAAAKDSSQPEASPSGNRPLSKGAVPSLTDEDVAAAFSLGSPGTAAVPAADSVLEMAFAEEPSSLPPAAPLRANPEPASLLLLATGLGLAARQLQRRTWASRRA
jgi:hypothetical protein